MWLWQRALREAGPARRKGRLGRGGSRWVALWRPLRQVTLSEMGAVDGLGAETGGLTEAWKDHQLL